MVKMTSNTTITCHIPNKIHHNTQHSSRKVWAWLLIVDAQREIVWSNYNFLAYVSDVVGAPDAFCGRFVYVCMDKGLQHVCDFTDVYKHVWYEPKYYTQYFDHNPELMMSERCSEIDVQPLWQGCTVHDLMFTLTFAQSCYPRRSGNKLDACVHMWVSCFATQQPLQIAHN